MTQKASHSTEIPCLVSYGELQFSQKASNQPNKKRFIKNNSLKAFSTNMCLF